MNTIISIAEKRKKRTLEQMGIPFMNTSDLGNAQRLVAFNGDKIRYCDRWQKWLIWNDVRWEKDETQSIRRIAIQTVQGIYGEAMNEMDEDRRLKLAKHALASESTHSIKQMISLSEADGQIAVTPGQLDRNDWLLNTPTGVMDLRHGHFRKHEREDMMTKVTVAEFVPGASCPTWLSFLDRIMGGNQNLIAFLKRAVGYSLTGDVSEQVLFFLYGRGANGKSTFLNVLLDLLGDYAIQSEPGLLMAKRNESHPTGIADLMGSRLVVSSEIDEGKRLAESLVKQLTGGDRLKARYMRGDFFEFDAHHKIWLAANHRPVIKSVDHGIWRRIKLIPFEVTIPEEDRDPYLKDKLLAELPGILLWAVQGCLEWQAGGLGTPIEVEEATAEYRAAQNTVSDFIDDCCVLHENARATIGGLYQAYVKWAEDNGETPLGSRVFSERIQEHCSRQKSGSVRYWKGIGLRDA